ncbi:MAG: hypothetical protein CVV22_08080 [Ignavibacteriae bacterium HGW-Ignavibacteriae-1]|jgi:hypothetical protein|nr:MAG: hypothetical protein CVV22_08080 [Ignavibacteriae bacterium HGW-Ignavibacteriae-1]
MKYSVLLILTFLVFVSCTETGVNNGDNAKEIWPLKIGNSWTYNTYRYFSSDMDSLSFLITQTLRVSKKVTIMDEDWYFFESEGKMVKVAMTNRKDGLWTIDFKDSTKINVDSAKLRYKYPTKLNETYPSNSPAAITRSLNTEVVTPAGKFSCIWYSNYNHIGTHENEGVFCAPGIGDIKQEWIKNIDNNVNPPDTSWHRTILVSYVIK